MRTMNVEELNGFSSGLQRIYIFKYLDLYPFRPKRTQTPEDEPKYKQGKLNLLERSFSNLIVEKFLGVFNYLDIWLCKCQCGRDRVVTGKNLKSKKIKNCVICCGRLQKINGGNYV